MFLWLNFWKIRFMWCSFIRYWFSTFNEISTIILSWVMACWRLKGMNVKNELIFELESLWLLQCYHDTYNYLHHNLSILIIPDQVWSVMIKYVVYDQLWSAMSVMLYLSTLSKLLQHCQCWKRWHNSQWWSVMIGYDQLWSAMITLITLSVPFRAALIIDKTWSLTDKRWSGFNQMSTFQ